MRAVGVNFADHLMRRGAYRGETPPLTPGLELAGDVLAIGPDVTGFRDGQRVFGWGRKTYAEQSVALASKLLPIPDGLSYEQAAAIPVVYGTAWTSLRSLANLQPGERLLVHAAGSGVGTAAIQLGRELGAWIVATAGADWKLERARELGADEVVNYCAVEDLAAELAQRTGGEGVDVALEGVGRATFKASVQTLKSMGRLVIYGAPSGAWVELDTRQAIFKNLTLYGLAITAEPRSQQTVDALQRRRLAADVSRGVLPILHRVLPLAEAAEAHRLLLDRGNFGKLVLTIDG